jgi:light-regulated signal transduction histidine kinase (bacteriophytochrome)
VDDSEEDREIFRRYLLQDTAYTYYIQEEETGEQGLSLCHHVTPDCILLDYNLPDMNGLEFLDTLANGEEMVRVPVVMLTGMGDEEVAQLAMKRGAQDYLVKGEMTAGNLYRAIHSAIERNTMRQALEQQSSVLEQKNQELQAFAYALAHDLRAPLRAISGFAQIIVEDYSRVLDDDGTRYVQRIVRASAQMDQLIDDLLNYTRIEHRQVRRKPVVLSYLLPQVIEGLANRIAETEAQVTLVGTFPTVYGDQTLVNQIFVNLLSNALKYHRPDVPPCVRIDAEVQGQWCILRVADNGIGIAEKHQKKIFTIFQRLHTEEEYPGTGIGLAIVKKAVELQDGVVWVESRVDEGSTFFVKLPLYIS